MRARTKAITAENQFTDWLTVKRGGVITLRGGFNATVTLQRIGLDGQVVDVTDNSGNVTTFTKAGTYTINAYEYPSRYRVGVKAGEFVAGPLNAMIEGN